MKNLNIFYSQKNEYFLNKIKNNEHFKYSRFNDGELIAIAHPTEHRANCDNHIYYPEMGEKLKNILLNYNMSETYILESYEYWYNTNKLISQTINNLCTKNENLKFLNADFIRITHENNYLYFLELLKVLKTKQLIVVGPLYLQDLKAFFDFKFIEIPLKNCYLKIDNIINELQSVIRDSTNNYVLISASMPTSIIIDYFKNDKNNTYIAWGSVWDTFFVSKKYNFLKKRSTSNKKHIIEQYKQYWI